MRHLAAWVAWWIGLFWLWLLLAGEWNGQELVAAAAAAAVSAALAEVARARLGAWDGVARVEASALWRLPQAVVVDFGIVVWALGLSLVRREVVRGAFYSRELPARDARDPGRRAWIELAASLSPNAYVVEIESDRRRAFVHDLLPRRSSEWPA